MLKPESKRPSVHATLYGEIKFFQSEKQYGFITETGSGAEYFFLRKDVALRDEDILRHLPVKFTLKEDINPKSGETVKRAVLVREIIQ